MIIVAAISGLLLVIYLLARVILLNSFSDLEQDDARRNLERATNTLRDQINYLTATTTDWAYWDDTYTFIQDKNTDYIESNLADEVFINLGLNVMIYVNASGDVVFQKAYDLKNEQETPLPDGLEVYLLPGRLLPGADAASLRRGIIVLPDGPMLVAARPILTSAKQGPACGTLIFGTFLDDNLIARLAESTRLPLVIARWDAPDRGDDFRAARAALSEDTPVIVTILGDNSIAGYTLLTDLDGRPAVILRAEFSRQIYARGETTLAYFMSILVVLGVVIGAALLMLLEKTVIAQAQMGTLLEHSSDVIILARPDGTIKQVNPAFRRMFNGLSAHYEGQSLSALFDTPFKPPLADIFHAVVEKRENQQVDVSLHDTARESVEANMILSPISRGNGHVSEVLCSLRDITAHKRLEDQLRKMLARETEMSELKSRMISIVSHELRTPLTTIQLAEESLSLFADRMSDERKQEKREQIKAAVQRMIFLLEDVLTLSRAESGKLQLEPAPFNLAELCATIVDNIRLSVRHNLTFKVSTDARSADVCMDQRLIQLILSNLLSNAAKYSPPGCTVSLDLKCEGEVCVIRVRDDGIGIPPEEQRKLFEPFFRARNVGTVTGTGLGLTIVKQAVEAHRGTIKFESQMGGGTTFTLRLPNSAQTTVMHQPLEQG